MAQIVKAIRGTRDLLPPDTALWNRVERTAREVFARYNFGEIRTPVLEATELFARGVGEETDIVSKEMYTWEDGERFDASKLRSAWGKSQIPPHFSVPRSLPTLFGVDTYYSSESIRRLYVNFRIKADLNFARELVNASKHDPEFYPIGNRYQLVVPAGRNPIGNPKEINVDGVEVEVLELAGDFFQSSQRLTLRPENTAGVVRAYIEHKLGDNGHLQKLYYIGPQFRRERPQKGRYRQFFQIGAEVIGPPTSGSESPLRDAEVLEMLATLLDELGIPRASAANEYKGWRLQLNSVGSSTDRPRYVAALREALLPVKDRMCPDNQRRAETNPLRVLDSKDEQDQEIINALPKIADYLDDDSKQHFAQVLAALDACGVPYTVNPRLVRGLDYYTRTTYEFTVDLGLGTQNALLGGGRYDGLSEMLGGPKAPGIGFAIGEDRLILTLQALAESAAVASGQTPEAEKIDAYIAPLSPTQNAAALALARELRAQGLKIEVGDGSFRLKKSFDAADRFARHIVILGEDEVVQNQAMVKAFSTGEQRRVSRDQLLPTLKT